MFYVILLLWPVSFLLNPCIENGALSIFAIVLFLIKTLQKEKPVKNKQIINAEPREGTTVSYSGSIERISYQNVKGSLDLFVKSAISKFRMIEGRCDISQRRGTNKHSIREKLAYPAEALYSELKKSFEERSFPRRLYGNIVFTYRMNRVELWVGEYDGNNMICNVVKVFSAKLFLK